MAISMGESIKYDINPKDNNQLDGGGAVSSDVHFSSSEVVSKDYKVDRSYSWITGKDLSEVPEEEVYEMDGSVPKWAVAVLKGGSIQEIRKKYNSARKDGYEIVEMRMDSLNPKSTPESKARMGVFIMQIAGFMREKAIASIRRGKDGGDTDDSKMDERTRLHHLRQLAEKGFIWLDVESDIERDALKNIVNAARDSGSGIIMSHPKRDGMEAFVGDPRRDSLADVHKLIVFVNDPLDVESMLTYLYSARASIKEKPVVLQVGGLYSDLFNSLLPLLGNSLNFTGFSNSFNPGKKRLAYLSSNESKLTWKLLGLTESGRGSNWSVGSKIFTENTSYGLVLGSRLEESLETPVLNSAFKQNGMDSICVPMKCGYEDVDRWLGFLRSFRSLGAWINMPLKALLARKVDTLEGTASQIGSINTLVSRNGKLIGYDTIGSGIADVVERYKPDNGARVGILGTGSAGRAAALEIKNRGYKTFLMGTSQKMTKKIVESLGGGMGAIASKNLPKMRGKVDVLVNTTPEGKEVGKENKNKTMGVAELARTVEPSVGIDIIFSPPWTPFLSAVESRGGVAVKGTDVLIYQLGRSFQLWTGKWPAIPDLKTVIEDAAFHLIQS